MERKTNPDVHIICGKCGCGTMMKYKVNETEMSVSLVCENCSTLTGLDELLERSEK